MSLPVKRPLDSLGTADSAPFVLNASASPNGAHAPGLDEYEASDRAVGRVPELL
jgi:hypothetical protein